MSAWSALLALFSAPTAAIAMDAAPASPKAEPEPFNVDMAIREALRHGRAQQEPQINPFLPRREDLPPSARKPGMAFDDNLGDFGPTAAWAFSGLGGLGFDGREGFIGYAPLSILATVPEYRRPTDIIAEDATSQWIELQSAGEKSNKAKIIAQIEEDMVKFDLKNVFHQALKHDGYFGRGHIYADIGKATDTPGELIMPIEDASGEISPAKVGKGKLNAFLNVEPIWVYAQKYNSIDPLKKDWYRPSEWLINGKTAHASRLLTIISRPVPDILKPAYYFGGMSITQMAKPVVENWLRTRKNVGDAINNFSTMILMTDVVNKLLADPTGANLFQRAEFYNLARDSRGLYMIDKNAEDFKNVSMPLGGLSDLQAQSQEHQSLPAGVEILTDRGPVAIEDVTLADRVLTRAGYAPIKWAGVTGTSATLIEIEVAGRIVRMTENHPVWSESTNEFVNAENVSLSHLLLVAGTTSQENTASLLRGEADGGGERSSDIIVTKRAGAFSIASFGKSIAGLFRTVSNAIIGTKTNRTTLLETLNWSLTPSILPSMASVSASIGSSGSTLSFARSAGTPSRPYGRTEQNTALPPVLTAPRSCEVDGPLIEHMPDRAKLAGINSPQSDRGARNSVRTLARAEPVTRVAAISVPRQLTYDIVVEDGWLPEFFANGVLVHNCSLFGIPVIRYLGMQPAGLNASSAGEIQIYKQNITSMQEYLLRPEITKALQIIQCNRFGRIDPDITFRFKPLETSTALEKAELEKLRADTATVHIGNRSVSREEERSRIANDEDTPYDSLDIDKPVEMEATDMASVAQAGTTAIASAFSEGITDRATALKELKKLGKITGIGAEIDDDLIKEAEEEPPMPGPEELKAQARMEAAGGAVPGEKSKPSSAAPQGPAQPAPDPTP